MYRSYRTGALFGAGTMPPGVKQLILITGGVYLVQLVFPAVTVFFGLYPPAVLSLKVWGLFTYMFLHGGLFHLLMNMFMLYMFGSQLEQVWGRRRFIRYYLLCGVGAGLFALLPLPAFFDALHIGASGAVYGVLLAFGLLFPSAQVYLLGILPMSARHMVILFGFISLAGSLSATSGGVSHIAHLGGLVVGYVLLRRDGLIPRRQSRLGLLWNDLRRRRRRARFGRYYEEHGRPAVRNAPVTGSAPHSARTPFDSGADKLLQRAVHWPRLAHAVHLSVAKKGPTEEAAMKLRLTVPAAAAFALAFLIARRRSRRILPPRRRSSSHRTRSLSNKSASRWSSGDASRERRTAPFRASPSTSTGPTSSTPSGCTSRGRISATGREPTR